MTATRVQGVQAVPIDDELLLLVPARAEAHALNAAAAVVYTACDGQGSTAAMAQALLRSTGLPADDGLVQAALADLQDAGLVEGAVTDGPVSSRQQLARRLQLGPALARRLPSVETVLLPEVPALRPLRPVDVSYVPIADEAIDDMLALAACRPGDLVVEPGCGDARLLRAAAARHGCRGLGVDLDPLRVAEARALVARDGLADRVQIVEQDMFTLDLATADVLLLYILPTLNQRLLPQLQHLKPGARVVSHDFDLPGVVPDRAVQVYDAGTGYAKTFFLWTAPLKHADRHPVRRQWAQSSRIG